MTRPPRTPRTTAPLGEWIAAAYDASAAAGANALQQAFVATAFVRTMFLEAARDAAREAHPIVVLCLVSPSDRTPSGPPGAPPC